MRGQGPAQHYAATSVQRSSGTVPRHGLKMRFRTTWRKSWRLSCMNGFPAIGYVVPQRGPGAAGHLCAVRTGKLEVLRPFGGMP